FSGDWNMFHCNHNLPTFDHSWVKGLEDIKLFQYQDQVWFLATAKEFTSNFLCKTLIGNASKLVLLKGPYENRNEKNWLPFGYHDKLLAIYSYAPFKILELNPETGECTTFLDEEYLN